MTAVQSVASLYSGTCPKRDHAMVLGVGSFAHGILGILQEQGTEVSTYLTRPYGHFGPKQIGKTIDGHTTPNPLALFAQINPDFIIPQSIDWAQQSWAPDFLKSGIPILCPSGEALLLERDREFARQLCHRFGIPFPRSHFAKNLDEALGILLRERRGYVLKNPLCSPTSPIHTIVCESAEETEAWLPKLDFSEGVFLQEYLGRAELGHIALVSGGEIHSLISNQEYKRAFTGNMGIVAGAPLGGLVELDPGDRYGLAKTFLHPLLPWFRKTNFHGPVQITAIKTPEGWSALEYNVRLGVTCGPVILRLLQDPFRTLLATARNEKLRIEFNTNKPFACSLTLAGQGYPYTEIVGPEFPISYSDPINCDRWWNEVAEKKEGQLHVTGHRIADFIAMGKSLPESIQLAYANIARVRCLGSYYRTDMGESLSHASSLPATLRQMPSLVGDTIVELEKPSH